jgi:hypothetical protein
MNGMSREARWEEETRMSSEAFAKAKGWEKIGALAR